MTQLQLCLACIREKGVATTAQIAVATGLRQNVIAAILNLPVRRKEVVAVKVPTGRGPMTNEYRMA